MFVGLLKVRGVALLSSVAHSRDVALPTEFTFSRSPARPLVYNEHCCLTVKHGRRTCSEVHTPTRSGLHSDLEWVKLVNSFTGERK